ncbi:hypothetical protein [Pantoea endophytica]|uniref:hypothetical protein n=1 Tax=Pantoea endophytica TaxID=92488 RepID=UPI003018555A
MLWMEEGMYLRVEELPGGPRPLPLLSGFSLTMAYRALGCFNPSETSDAYFILSNDRDEVWFICNRHLRTMYLQRDSTAFRLPLASFDGQSLTGAAPALRSGFSD